MIEILFYNQMDKRMYSQCFSGHSVVSALLEIWNSGRTLRDVVRVERVQEPA